jgi:GDP-4-dehydro-6-deoxy-D-mannose reductase
VLFASSAEVYGEVAATDLPIDEEHPLAPANPYAFGKAAAELWVRSLGGVVVRCFNIIGRGQAASFALPTFARQLAAIRRGAADPVLRVGNLEAVRDFVHVDDAIAGMLVALDRAVDGSALNIASGVGSRLAEVVDQLIARAGVVVRIEHDPSRLRPAEAPRLVGDPRRLEALGWARQHDLADALDELLAEAHDLVTAKGDRP